MVLYQKTFLPIEYFKHHGLFQFSDSGNEFDLLLDRYNSIVKCDKLVILFKVLTHV